MFFKLFILVALNLNPVNTPGSENSLVKSARSAYAKGEFLEARAKYEELLKLNPNSIDYNFEAGLSYFSSEIEKEKSLGYFEKALALDTQHDIPEILYYCGLASHYNEKYDQAIGYFNQFKSYIDPKSGTDLTETVDRCIVICKEAKFLAEQPVVKELELVNMGSKINSMYSEYGAIVSEDGTKMIFTARKRGSTGGKTFYDNKYFEDIYISEKVNDEWKESIKLDSLLKFTSQKVNSQYHNAVVAFNKDETKLYIYRDSDIYESELTENKWSDPVKMSNNLNSDEFEPSIYISKDEQFLIITSNKEGGLGGRDLYIANKTSDGKWGNPVNLGSTINTPEDEDAPFLSADGNTLFFSSKGHSTTGGYDIFKSIRNSKGEWEKPVNLGAPFNSPADDIYYTENNDQKTVYLSSNRKSGQGSMDIWMIQDKTEEPIEKDTTNLVDNVDTAQIPTLLSSIFEENFKYNVIEISGSKMSFETFIKETSTIINQKGNVEIFISSSASYVPTTTFKTNKNLSEKRAEMTRAKIEKALTAAGFKTDKYSFKIESKVQGPKYKNDYDTNQSEYEKYQYIKVAVQ